MGRGSKFHKPLTRQALNKWPRVLGAGGTYQGTKPANMAWELFLACSSGDGINANTYVQLHTIIDYDGLFDLIELNDVQQSWAQARALNMRESSRDG